MDTVRDMSAVLPVAFLTDAVSLGYAVSNFVFKTLPVCQRYRLLARVKPRAVLPYP